MKANPGGNLDPSHVVGRDKLIEQIWERLETQSVLINAERRIGKTQTLKKMLAQPKAGWKPVFRDLEKIHTAQEFAEHVYNDVQEFLGSTARAKNFIQRFFEEHETDHVNLKARTWKKLLTSAIEDVVRAGRPERLVFFWDEVPYMLESIRSRDGDQMAAELLDTLRSLRVEQERFRVILTGSIGLHHVIGKLTEASIPSSPVNDLYSITVTPLAPADAQALAKALLTGEGIECTSIDDVAASIGEQVDYFPFYIHHVVAGLKIDQQRGTEENVREYIDRQLVDASDPWQLAHYRTRLASYYPAARDAQTVTAILDVLATIHDTESLAVNEVRKETEVRGSQTSSRDDTLRLLRLMDADHYLVRDTDGKYSFRFPLIRRWWKLDRGLA